MRRRLLIISGHGGDSNSGSGSGWDDGSSGSGAGGGWIAAPATVAPTARAFRRADRIAARASTPNVCIGTGVVLVALAKRAHAAHRAGAWPSRVREDVGRGTRQLWKVKVGIPTKLGSAEFG